MNRRLYNASIAAIAIAVLLFASAVRRAAPETFTLDVEMPPVRASHALFPLLHVQAYAFNGVRMSAIAGSGLGAYARSGSGVAPPAQQITLGVFGQSTSIGQTEGSLPDGGSQYWLSTAFEGNSPAGPDWEPWTTYCPASDGGNPWPTPAVPAGAGYIPNYLDCGSTMQDANSPYWEELPLREPVNNGTPGTSINVWPLNDYGFETPGVAFNQQAHASTASLWNTQPRFVWDSEGVSGQPYSAIGVGTAAWNQWIVTETAVHNLAVDGGGTHIVGAYFVRWGQSDCANWGGGATLTSFASSTSAAFRTITGQNRVGQACPLCIPMIFEQVQNWCGTGFRVVSTEQLAIAQAATPGTMLSSGPQYDGEPSYLHLEHNDVYGNAHAGEVGGDYYAQYEAWQVGQHEWPLPLAPIKIGQIHGSNGSVGTQDFPDPATFTVTGSGPYTVTIRLHVPAGETPQFDTTFFPALHTFGPWQPYWSGMYGFEAWNGCNYVDGGGGPDAMVPAPPGTVGIGNAMCTPIPITATTLTNVSGTWTVTLTVDSSWAAGTNAGSLLAYAQSPDGNLYLDGGVFDGGVPAGSGSNGNAAVGWGPPNGAAGQLRTDYLKTGARSGIPIRHWAASWIQGGF
jgi:hypothetical protein